ncbi:MAG: TonB-dependent receptor [Vicingaceae bacterium]|nr:MAG: TonB-dependent receptor [Vicingaceae bacterium]
MRKLLLFGWLILEGVLLTAQQPDTLRIIDSLAKEEWQLPVLTTTAGDAGDGFESIDLAGVLQASRDLYYFTSAFNLGQSRYRIRGYNSDLTAVSINGVRFNDEERGWASWSSWGGLNDITRYREIQVGIAPAMYYFSPIGGYSDINARASNFTGSRFSYASSNRAYRHRVMATHGTGWLENNWAYTVSLSGRYAKEGYVPGTFYQGYSYFIAAEKKITENKRINFSFLGNYVQQGRQSINVEETYLLTNNKYYNSYWGWQNGEKRNSRVSTYHKPIALITFDNKVSDKTMYSATAYAQFGMSGITGLNWYDAPDPRPDYYRYLPSYYAESNPVYAQQLTYNWQNDPNTSQINWNALYQANYKNLYQVNNANGINGNTIEGLRSKYILEEYRTDPFLLGFNGYFRHYLKDNLKLSGGLNAEKYSSDNYKRLADLLGGDFWLDVDQFAEQDFADPNAAQNDLNTPNRVVKENDVYGYHYKMHKSSGEIFSQIDHSFKKFKYFLAGFFNYTSFYREGFMKNGLFPENSYGKSPKNTFYTGGFKGGITYAFNGNHYITSNMAWFTQAPTIFNAYISPRTRDFIVPGLKPVEIRSADISLHSKFNRFAIRLTGFYTEINNSTWSRTYYHDVFRAFVNYTMSGVNYLYQGFEGLLEYKINSALSAYITGGWGQYLYNSRPLATITRDNSAELLAQNRVVYIKNYRLGGMPQAAGSFGIRYSKNFWFGGINFNYIDNIYVDINPDRRTLEALEGIIPSDPQYTELLQQQKLDPGYTIDFYVGKSWKIKKYIIAFNINVYNILNNQDIIPLAFEQMRYDPKNIDKFPVRFAYQIGRNYFGMLTFRF